MKQKYLRDQRGVAMILELILVAAVLALAGLAVYQANHRASSNVATHTSQPSPAPNSTEGLANSAASIATQGSTSDTAASAGADAMADQASAAESDVSNLGDSANASF